MRQSAFGFKNISILPALATVIIRAAQDLKPAVQSFDEFGFAENRLKANENATAKSDTAI
jgi:hypothetical protein